MGPSLLRVRRTGGAFPPDLELLAVEADGSFRLWRTIAEASRPPSPVGAFGGTVPPALLERLSALTPAEDVTLPLPADAATLEVEVGGHRLQGPDDARPTGAWAEVVEVVGALLGSLTDQPVAAVALEVEPDGSSAALHHRGPHGLWLSLARVGVLVTTWKAPGEVADQWRWDGDLTGDAPPDDATGWTIPLPFDHGLTIIEPPTVEVEVGIELSLEEPAGATPVVSPRRDQPAGRRPSAGGLTARPRRRPAAGRRRTLPRPWRPRAGAAQLEGSARRRRPRGVLRQGLRGRDPRRDRRAGGGHDRRGVRPLRRQARPADPGRRADACGRARAVGRLHPAGQPGGGGRPLRPAPGGWARPRGAAAARRCRGRGGGTRTWPRCSEPGSRPTSTCRPAPPPAAVRSASWRRRWHPTTWLG